jgi:hypothetical protein
MLNPHVLRYFPTLFMLQLSRCTNETPSASEKILKSPFIRQSSRTNLLVLNLLKIGVKPGSIGLRSLRLWLGGRWGCHSRSKHEKAHKCLDYAA